MISDFDILGLVASKRFVAGVRGIALLLDIEADDEFTKQVGRLVREEQLGRTSIPGGGFHYRITTKGREALKAEGYTPPPMSAPPAPEATAPPAPERPPPQPPPKPAAPPPPPKPAEPASPPKPQSSKEPEMTAEKQTTAERIVAAIAATPGIQPAQVAEKLGLKVSIVYAAVFKLKKTGEVMKGDSGGLVIGKAAAPAEKPARKAARKNAAPKPRRKKIARKAKLKVARRPKARASHHLDVVITNGASAKPMASFTAKGEIVVNAPGGVKILDTDESREVIELVRITDERGLLPKAA